MALESASRGTGGQAGPVPTPRPASGRERSPGPKQFEHGRDAREQVDLSEEDVSVRRRAARAVPAVAAGLTLDEVLDFSRSPSTGERVGAAIALRAHLHADHEACTKPAVRFA